MKIYKQQLLNTVVEKLGEEYSKKIVENVVSTLIDTVAEMLTNGDSVSLTRFGTFGIKTRKERTLNNPITRTPMFVPEKLVPVFKASKTLKQLVRK
jgi:DNA-binding protein HU-beta